MNDISQRRDAAEGLRGLGWLERWDRVGVPSLQLFLYSLIAAIALHGALFFVVGSLSDRVAEVPISPQLMLAGYLVLGVITGIYLSLTYSLARWLQRLFEQQLDWLDLSDFVAELRPRRRDFIKNTLIITPIVGIVFDLSSRYAFGIGMFSLEMLHAPAHIVVVMWLVIPSQLVLAIINFSCLNRVTHFLWRTARTVPIELLRLSRYSCIAAPAVAFFCYASALFGSWGIATLFVDGNVQIGMAIILLMFPLMAIAIMVPLIYPVWLLRKRIARRIEAERSMTLAALAGEPAALARSQLGHPPANAEANLLTRLMFIDTLPEWPIGPQLRRVIVFGLLPPVAWVMAAAVENLLY